MQSLALLPPVAGFACCPLLAECLGSEACAVQRSGHACRIRVSAQRVRLHRAACVLPAFIPSAYAPLAKACSAGALQASRAIPLPSGQAALGGSSILRGQARWRLQANYLGYGACA